MKRKSIPSLRLVVIGGGKHHLFQHFPLKPGKGTCTEGVFPARRRPAQQVRGQQASLSEFPNTQVPRAPGSKEGGRSARPGPAPPRRAQRSASPRRLAEVPQPWGQRQAVKRTSRGAVCCGSPSSSFHLGITRMVVTKSEAGRAASGYFRRARRLPSLVTVLGLGYFAWVVFWPQSIPYQSLGTLGLFTQYLVDHHHTLLRSGYWLAWLIHVGEALYAMVLCKSKGITDGRAQVLWFLQTFLFGVASLSILIAYRPKRQKQT